MKKYFLALFAFAALILPSTAAAAEIKTEFNPMCWTEVECNEKRQELLGEDYKTGGWLEKEGDCDKLGWGKCLAGAVTETEISFGGTNKFTNIGDYIKTIYNYGIVILGILAVVVIIIAGLQWISSAGSSEKITQAKKRISGAVIGLIIAYMSYIILKSINPATVELRLPQVYLIKSQVLASKWCKDTPKSGGEDAKFSLAADQYNQKTNVEATGGGAFSLVYANDNPYSMDFWCGKRYFVAGAGADVTCLGDRCDAGYVCSDMDPPDNNNPYHCVVATIAGDITGLESGVVEGAVGSNSWKQVDNSLELHLVCNNGTLGTTEEVSVDYNISDESGGKQSYKIKAKTADLNDAIQQCGGEEKVIGAYMVMELTPNVSANPSDENHVIGAGGADIFYYNAYGNALEDAPKVWLDNVWIPLSAIKSGTIINVNAKNVNQIETAYGMVSWTLDWAFGDATISDLQNQFYRKYKIYMKPEYANYITGE